MTEQGACFTGPVAMQQVLRMVKVDGDGDCLFHALAFVDGYDGGALRIEVAEFLEQHAHAQAGFQEEWLLEAAKLRRNKWGGHTVIAAYSVMKNTRVVLHTKESQGGAVKVEEMSHASVHGRDDARVVHILYNGVDHYDALVEIAAGLPGMVPAWPQPLPQLYFKAEEQHENFPSLAAGAKEQAKPKKQGGLTAPRPAKKAKAKAAAKGKAKEAKPASVKPKKDACKKDKDEEVAAPGLAAAAYAPSLPEEGEEEDFASPGLMEALEAVPVAEASHHPHRKVEHMIQEGAFNASFRIHFRT